MKEIGGYFELEKPISKEYREDTLAFNSVRNGLQFIVRERKIRKIYIPYYLCLVIEDVLKKEYVEIGYYHIDDNFMPLLDSTNDVVFIVNYFGLLGESQLLELKNKYQNIILDNTHAFFMKAMSGVDTLFNCRKYFGVPDGAYLATDLELGGKQYECAKSISRIRHIIGRYESGASEYYDDFLKADEEFSDLDIEMMSRTTHNMLSNIDYQYSKERRVRNFENLDKKLGKHNFLQNWRADQQRDFMYPLLVYGNGEELRAKLIANKIFVPKLWPGLEKFPLNEFEQSIFRDMILLPIDQRYGDEDMEFICRMVGENI